MQLKSPLVGLSTLAFFLAAPALAKDDVVVKEKHCKISVINGKVTKEGDCDEASIANIGTDVEDFRTIHVETSVDGKGGPGSVWIGSDDLPGGLRTWVGGGNHFFSAFGSHNEEWDTDEDGNISVEEIKAGKNKELAKHDKNRNRSLNLAEFESLWMAKERERMVDQFQDLDANGDGKVTQDEFSARATRHAGRKVKIMRRMKRHEEERD